MFSLVGVGAGGKSKLEKNISELGENAEGHRKSTPSYFAMLLIFLLIYIIN